MLETIKYLVEVTEDYGLVDGLIAELKGRWKLWFHRHFKACPSWCFEWRYAWEPCEIVDEPEEHCGITLDEDDDLFPECEVDLEFN